MGVQSNKIRQLSAPVVRLSGQEVNASNGKVVWNRTGKENPSTGQPNSYTSLTIISRNRKEVVVSNNGKKVAHEGSHIFRKKVILSIIPVQDIYRYPYETIVKSIDYYLTGSKMVTKTNEAMSPTRILIGKKAELYFTFNGKSPKRTKSNLWMGTPITIRDNPAGMEETVLKAKTYYNGTWSEVITVRFRIVKGTIRCFSTPFSSFR